VHRACFAGVAQERLARVEAVFVPSSKGCPMEGPETLNLVEIEVNNNGQADP
jgi:hypothetical protein